MHISACFMAFLQLCKIAAVVVGCVNVCVVLMVWVFRRFEWGNGLDSILFEFGSFFFIN